MNRRFLMCRWRAYLNSSARIPSWEVFFNRRQGRKEVGFHVLFISLSRRPENLEWKKAQSFSIKSTLLSN